jgi:hypothetical protein
VFYSKISRLILLAKLSASVVRNIYSVLILSLIIIYFKLKKKKIIFFYHPKKILTLIHKYYIEDLLEDMSENYSTIYGHEVNKNIGKKYFYIKQGYLKFILNIDLFISNNVCDVFTKNSIRIYMHHDIYDTPLVSDKKEKELFLRLIKYDYLFLPNRQSIIMFQNFFKKNNSDFKNKIPRIMETGYVKLDYLRKNIHLDKTIKNNSIIIAPTNPFAIEKLSIFNYLDELIDILLANVKFEIMFRPHPSNRKDQKILKIVRTFKNNKNFYFDISENYSNTYSKSCCLITDLSGTAYTYAFFTKKPVIFCSKNEKLINELGYHKLAYFKDREKIGIIIQDLKQIKNTMDNIKFIEKKIKNSNDLLEKQMNYLGNSKIRIKQLIRKILIKK